MLFEPGPLRLVLDDEFPVRGPLPRFAALVARESEQLEAAATAIGLDAGIVARALETEIEGPGGLDLALVSTELASQSRDVDPAIGSVAATADALEAALAGLTGQVPSDFAGPPTPPSPAAPGDYRTGQPGGKRGDEERGGERGGGRDPRGGAGTGDDTGGGTEGEATPPPSPPPVPPPVVEEPGEKPGPPERMREER